MILLAIKLPIKIFKFLFRIPVLMLPEFWYFRNSNELLGLYKTIVDTLTSMPYTVVVINDSVWAKVPKEEKTSFLMKEIQLKLTVPLNKLL